MNNREFKNSINKITPSNEQKSRMLKNITKKFERKNNMKIKKIVPVFALSCTILVGGLFIVPKFTNTDINIENPSSDSYMEIRKFMNFDGNRYEFLENGKSYNLDTLNLGEKLGKLEYKIEEGIEVNNFKDFASTFAINGEVYEIKEYNKEFRVAVKLGSDIYICQNVDETNDSKVDLLKYFENADLKAITKSITVYDHFGLNELGSIKDNNIDSFISDIQVSNILELGSDEYEKISKAQSDDKSYLLKFNLNKGPDFNMYIIPELNIISVGDNYFKLSENIMFDIENLN